MKKRKIRRDFVNDCAGFSESIFKERKFVGFINSNDKAFRTPHKLEALDGLRGVAAIAVVFHHIGSTWDIPGLVEHGYLAVDLFFVISGVVLTFAYGTKAKTMTISDFLKRRAIRLLPMVVIGTVLGAFLAPFRFRLHEPAAFDLLKATVLGSLALPVFSSGTLPHETFPIDGPIWSITFEMLASFAFIGGLNKRMILPWAMLSAVVSLFALAYISYLHGNISVGPLPENWLGGFARVGYSFAVGCIVFLNVRPFNFRNSTVLAIILCLIPLQLPVWSVDNGMFEIFVVSLLFPLAINKLSNVHVSGLTRKVCSLSGEISYPIYAIHYPVVLAIASVKHIAILSSLDKLFLAFATVLVLVAISVTLSRFVDIPIRNWMTKSLTAHANATNSTARL